MPTTVTITGFKEFEAKLKNLPKQLMDEIGGEVEDAGRYWVERAKQDCPVDKGFLRGAITSEYKDLQATVTSPIEYSPYVEWGTGTRAVVPGDLAYYAGRWWTHKVHLGRHPHPFFFIQIPFVQKQLNGNVKKIMETEH
jgi:hypothetical protein